MTSDISSSQSYQPADPREPVLDISIGDALRAAAAQMLRKLHARSCNASRQVSNVRHLVGERAGMDPEPF
jgi:hypothetical protein